MAGMSRRVVGVARTVTAVLVLTFAISGVAQLASAPPATAGIASNFYTTDEDGAGAVTQFTTAEPVYLLASVTLPGAYICLSAMGGRSCGGSKIPLLPGSSSEVRPLFSPGQVRPGTYQLLETDGNGVVQAGADGSVHASLEFTVRVGSCAADALVLCAAKLAAFKESSRRMAETARSISGLGFTAFGLGTVGAGLAITVAGGGGLLPIVMTFQAASVRAAASSMGSTALLGRDAAKRFDDLAADPPDPDFQAVAAPQFSSLPASSNPRERAVHDGLASQDGYGQAMLTALERYQGAAAANDAPASAKQLRALADYSGELADGIESWVVAMRAYAEDPAYDTAMLTTQQRSDTKATIARVVSSGLTEAERQQLVALGATSAGIAEAETLVKGLRPDDIPAAATRAGYLYELADRAAVEVDSIRALGDDAGRLADTIDTGQRGTAPAAVVRVNPSGGLAPLAVTLDGSESVDDGTITGYVWQFSDGTTATGKTVSRVFAEAGDDQVQLTVTDDDGNTGTVTAWVSTTSEPTVLVPICGDQGDGEVQTKCDQWTPTDTVNMFRVRGTGAAVPVVFDYVYHAAALSSELFVTPVDDASGSIMGLKPGQAGYEQVFLRRGLTVFPQGAEPDIADKTLTFPGGQYLVPGIVPGWSLEQLLLQNPDNILNAGAVAYTTAATRNPDGIAHALTFTNAAHAVQFGFEDLPGGMGDFDDLVFTATTMDVVERVGMTLTTPLPTVGVAAATSYSLRLTNPASSAVQLSSVSATLPVGFTYRAGTTQGPTQANPTITGSVLRWSGPFTLPAGAAATLSFGVKTGSATGTFTASAAGRVAEQPIAGTGPAAPISVVADAARGTFTPVTPRRILDTRPAPNGPIGRPAAGRVGPGQSIAVKVTGVGGVPATGVEAVVLNVTGVAPTASGYLTVYPSGTTRPLASNLNLVPQVGAVPNLVVAKVGGDGRVAIYNHAGSTHVAADIVGWYSAAGGIQGHRYTPQSPLRILDTRVPLGVGTKAPVGPGRELRLQVAGASGVPADAKGVVLNVTVDRTTASSYLTVYPAGVPRPLASNLNWTAGVVVPNLVYSPIGTSGEIRIYNNAGSADVVADVVGWFGPTGQFVYHPVNPVRLVDTRSSSAGPIGAGKERVLDLTGGASPAPHGAGAVIVNTTVTNTTGSSYLTVYPDSGIGRPTASSLNWVAGRTVPNLVPTQVTATGGVRVYNFRGSTDLAMDLTGWYGP